MKTFKIILALIILAIFVTNFKLYYIDKLSLTPIDAYFKGIIMTILLIYLNKK